MDLNLVARQIINLFVPVSICMAMVVFTMNRINFYTHSGLQHSIYTPFVKETYEIGEIALMSFGNALSMAGVVVFGTCLVAILYKYLGKKVLDVLFLICGCCTLFAFTTSYIHEVLKHYDVPLSTVTVGFLIFNFVVLGVMCIYWKGPLRLQQFFLITSSALTALGLIKNLTEWTVWAVLAVMSLWDIVAVLAPKGPLRVIIETAQERNEAIFTGVIYSSGVLNGLLDVTDYDKTSEKSETTIADGASSSNESNSFTSNLLQDAKSKKPKVKPASVSPDYSSCKVAMNLDYVELENQPETRKRRQSVAENVEDEGVHLGLGDFIFYSILIGKASSFADWNTTVACYIAIIVGLCVTLLLLRIFERALPALPISIFAGLIFYFGTRWIITPFVMELTENQLVF